MAACAPSTPSSPLKNVNPVDAAGTESDVQLVQHQTYSWHIVKRKTTHEYRALNIRWAEALNWNFLSASPAERF